LFDNVLAEFASGGIVLQWENALLENFPIEWAIPVVEVVDPKAKSPAKPAEGAETKSPELEAREKYLETVETVVKNQAGVTYLLDIDPGNFKESNGPRLSSMGSCKRKLKEVLR
jgi:hypothetical protein